MEKQFKDLLENEVFTDEVKAGLQEAWETKTNELREQVKQETETALREEYAQRFEHDKGVLVEAMDRMIQDVIRKELDEFSIDRKALAEQRVKLSKAIRESRKEYNVKLSEQMAAFKTFFMNQMKNELVEFKNDRKSLSEAKAQAKAKLTESREVLKEQTAERLNKLEKFVIGQLTKEIREFQEDRRSLVESKVKLIREGKTKINESRKQFVKRAAQLAEKTIQTALRKEFSQFREDIKVARENNFGRKIFEAFAPEFLASHFSEGTRLKKVMEENKALNNKLVESQKVAEEKTRLVESTQRKVQMAEESAERVRVLNELLTSLGREKREVMEELLESTKTKNLREAFHRYLPSVMDAGQAGKAKTVLRENEVAQKQLREVTGNRENILSESAKKEEMTSVEQTAEVIELKKLAGIK